MGVWRGYRLLALVALGVCVVLAGCHPVPFTWGPPVMRQPPPPPPLPPLVPDPLAASGPASVHAVLDVVTPSLALGSVLPLDPQGPHGVLELTMPMGLYPAGSDRPTRQQLFNVGGFTAGDVAGGDYRYALDFTAVPTGEYTLRAASWTYTFIEQYGELARSAPFTLTEALPVPTEHVTYSAWRGGGSLRGRILYGQGAVPAQTSLRLFNNEAVPSGDYWQIYDFSPAAVAPEGRLYFAFDQLHAGSYAVGTDNLSAPVVVTDPPQSAPPQVLLLAAYGAQPQLAPLIPSENMFFGFVQLTGAQTWQGDLRITARPAGSSPDSAPSAWMWLSPDPALIGWDTFASAPWYGYYKDSPGQYPPPGLGYGLEPLAPGAYDIYAELYGAQSGQRLAVKLATQSIPPADMALLYWDNQHKGKPYWVAQPLQLNLSAAQATAFAD